ncbi:MAG: FkbM family methyltransferase, partial [Pseudomonadota bacterium]
DPARSATAISRSLGIYYRDAARTARMDRLNRLFVPRGGLAFDVGAHVGDRVASFLRLGASVVAVEPQPRVFRALRLLYGRCDRVRLEERAVGAEAGHLELFINSANPTVSTLSPHLIAAARTAEGWDGEAWDQTWRVPVTTLDQLIATHGVPAFLKIDVEGYEAEALQGLSVPVPAVSFEFTTIQRDLVETCVDRLCGLGAYRFNLSLGEAHALRSRHWVSAPEIVAHVRSLPMQANSGDIYARLDTTTD